MSQTCRVTIVSYSKEGRQLNRVHTGCSIHRSDEEIIRWAKYKHKHHLAERVEVHISRPVKQDGFASPGAIAAVFMVVYWLTIGAMLLAATGCAAGDGRCLPGDQECEAARLRTLADRAAAINHNIEKRLYPPCCREHPYENHCR